MAKEEYRISKVTVSDYTVYNGIDVDFITDGYIITLTNIKNPFDYFTQKIPEEAYTREEFEIGRIIELED